MKNGISLLLPSLNMISTIEACVRSFYEFADEIIVVDNGSNDGTVDVLHELSKELTKVSFHHQPELKDLHHVRQFGFEKTQKFRWVARFDSDYVAYTSGDRDIKQLRQLILKQPRGIRPKAFGVKMINLFQSQNQIGLPLEFKKKGTTIAIPPPVSQLPFRVVERIPGLDFRAHNRIEGVRWQRTKLWKHMTLSEHYWVHCTFKSKVDHLIRVNRNYWRAINDYEKYPSRMDYINSILMEKYGTNDIGKAAEKLWEETITPYLVEVPLGPNIEPLPELMKLVKSSTK